MRKFLFILGFVLAMTSGAMAQSSEDEFNELDAVRENLLEQANRYKFESLAQSNDPVDLRLHDESLLNWTNPVRGADLGITVIWKDEGLPLAFVTLFTAGGSTRHSLTSLSEFPLRVNYEGKKTWTPTPGVVWREWEPKKTSIAKTEALRMVQMKAIAGQFEFRLKPGGNPSVLELMSEPLHRFKSEKHGTLDGALFAFAEGNDAEVLFMVRADETSRTWKYACARCGWFEMTGTVKSKPVWKVNPVKSERTKPGTQPYMNSPYLSGSPPIAEANYVGFDDQEVVGGVIEPAEQPAEQPSKE